MATPYEIRVPYAASDLRREAFPELTVLAIAGDTPLLVGPLRDQSELPGVLARISDLDLDLHEVRARP